MTRLDLIKQMILTPEAIKGMGKGLPLFLFTALSSGKNNMLKTSYEQIETVLGVPQSTSKKWRDCLVANKVLEVVSGKGSMILKLLSPYDAIATCELDDFAVIKSIGDPSLQRMLKDMSSIDSLTILSSMGKFADELKGIKQMIVKNHEEGN